MAIRTRRDAWKLDEWDDTFLWYAKAVGAMLQRKIADPTSWRYQAAIHDYRRAGDPLAKRQDRLPSRSEQRRFWSQCQHNSWYFLPWHRWYLLYFEETVAATVVKLGGPAGWSLPYWNYSDTANRNARRLPPALRALELPDGSPNPLRVQDRDEGNDGGLVGDESDVALDCLEEPEYVADSGGGSPGFGGPETGFNHSGGNVGALEATPHGAMHVAVGGWMGSFNTAGLDPLFWMHHANIDRLWDVWRKRDQQHIDPTDRDWLDMRFDFHDGQGKVVSRLLRDVVDTNALGYEYEDTSDPLSGGGLATMETREIPRRPKVAARRIPEMVGASEAPVPLTTQPTTTDVSMAAPTGPALESLDEGPAAEQRVYINVENVTGHGRPRRYSVFVNGVFAGILPLFGVQEATEETESHPGDGLHFRIDATKAVRQLQAEGKWDPATVQVTFVPDTKKPTTGFEAMAEAAEPRFEVGRVSVFVK